MEKQENSMEHKSTEVWVTPVFVLLKSNHTGDESTKRLGELLGACVGRFAGLKAGQNAGTFVLETAQVSQQVKNLDCRV